MITPKSTRASWERGSPLLLEGNQVVLRRAQLGEMHRGLARELVTRARLLDHGGDRTRVGLSRSPRREGPRPSPKGAIRSAGEIAGDEEQTRNPARARIGRKRHRDRTVALRRAAHVEDDRVDVAALRDDRRLRADLERRASRFDRGREQLARGRLAHETDHHLQGRHVGLGAAKPLRANLSQPCLPFRKSQRPLSCQATRYCR